MSGNHRLQLFSRAEVQPFPSYSKTSVLDFNLLILGEDEEFGGRPTSLHSVQCVSTTGRWYRVRVLDLKATHSLLHPSLAFRANSLYVCLL